MSDSTKTIAPFSERVLSWYQEYGRKDLPWQKDISPYRVWVSEIMLQQTQVVTVVDYFRRFMERFPTVESLAAASQDEVLSYWSGLGYYARGRNLHKASKEVVDRYGGIFPCDVEGLQSLPGIGRSTAAAICSIACGGAEPILDGNVKRVLARHGGIEGWPGKSSVLKALWQRAEAYMPSHSAAAYTQAMMDLGATLCSRSKPACDRCPVSKDCTAYELGRQKDFPASKPKKEKPLKSVQMLLLHDGAGGVVMQKRPAAGIWGGLWSLPEIAVGMERETEIHRRWSLKMIDQELWPVFKHSFSHYDLEIHPVVMQVVSEHNQIREMASDDSVWYNTGQPLPGGVPAPVALLIEQFQADFRKTAESN